ncbi:GSCFA domain-containing protein [Tenacibaculum sp. UWU-22]|uniref:GSCFA domain-containing protein n=1 Tax=Tenacibaculum sp. UWU-22 TaxID=3234187 RepID=UPI0034DB58B3
MQLQTNIPIKKQSCNLINYNAKLLLLGSCFSTNIGNKLAYYKFRTIENPFGILFHVKAIEKLIVNALNKKVYTQEDIFFHNERWNCFDAHSSLSATDKNQLLSTLNNALELTNKQVTNASHLVITLGTSWVYKEVASDNTVANCHKLPQKHFTKEILSVDEILKSLKNMITLVKSVNKDITVLFTVSPVRHLKDGFIANQQSKAHLITAIHQVVNQKEVCYFPAYEIMMDELRNYRFYTQDMLHPNSTAIDYIWDKFLIAWVADETNQTMQEIASLQKGLAHRPFNPNTEQHMLFVKKLEQQKTELQKKFPFMKFE